MNRILASPGLPLALALALLIGLAASGALAASPSCEAPASVWQPAAHGDYHFAVPPKGELRIVAIGSSSTSGVGASSPDASYPAQLAAILQQRFPGLSVAIENKGRGGETVAQNLARFERDVLGPRPDLVIWQVATNDVLRSIPPATVTRGLAAGLAHLKAKGIAAILMEPQYLPGKAGDERLRAMIKAVRRTASEQGVPLIRRFDLMRHWLESDQFTPALLLARDRLHMTDASYHCLAERLADAFERGGGG